MIPHQSIRSHLRMLWMWSDEWKNAKKRARFAKGAYRCEACQGFTAKPEIDHVVPCGPTPGSRNAKAEHTWDGFIDRLFNGELQALCAACHLAKTQKREGAA